MKPMTEKKFNEVYNFIDKNIDKVTGTKYAKDFSNAYNEGKATEWLTKNWPELEEYEAWTLKYNSVDDLTKSKEDQLKTIYKNNPDFSKISFPRMNTILANNDVTEDELRDYYARRNAEKKEIDEFNNRRYSEIKTNKAEAERADKYNSMLANEYARKHYIKGNKGQAIANEIAGKAAFASDFATLPISLAGPTIRAVQKWAADEPVITPGTGFDYVGAIVPDVAEKPAKMLWQYAKGSRLGKLLESKWGKQIENRIKAEDNKLAEQATKDLELTKGLDLDQLDNIQLVELYRNVKTPEIRSAIEEYWKAKGMVEEGKSLDELASTIAGRADALEGAERARALKDADLIAAAAEREARDEALITAERKADYLARKKQPELEVRSGKLPEEQPLFTNGDFNTYYRDVPLKDINEYMESQIEPSKFNDFIYQALKLGGRKTARTTLSGRTGQWDAIDYNPNYDEDKAVQEVKRMFMNSWSTNTKPEGYYTDPLIKAAYDKWVRFDAPYSYKDWRK